MALPGNPTIYNLTLTNANSEYSQTFPELCSKVMIHCRTAYDLKLSWTAGSSGTTYITIPSGQTYFDDLIHTSLTAYLQSAQAGVVAEIQVWSGA